MHCISKHISISLDAFVFTLYVQTTAQGLTVNWRATLQDWHLRLFTYLCNWLRMEFWFAWCFFYFKAGDNRGTPGGIVCSTWHSGCLQVFWVCQSFKEYDSTASLMMSSFQKILLKIIIFWTFRLWASLLSHGYFAESNLSYLWNGELWQYLGHWWQPGIMKVFIVLFFLTQCNLPPEINCGFVTLLS